MNKIRISFWEKDRFINGRGILKAHELHQLFFLGADELAGDPPADGTDLFAGVLGQIDSLDIIDLADTIFVQLQWMLGKQKADGLHFMLQDGAFVIISWARQYVDGRGLLLEQRQTGIRRFLSPLSHVPVHAPQQFRTAPPGLQAIETAGFH